MHDSNDYHDHDGAKNEAKRKPPVEAVEALLVAGAIVAVGAIDEQREVSQVRTRTHELTPRVAHRLATSRGP